MHSEVNVLYCSEQPRLTNSECVITFVHKHDVYVMLTVLQLVQKYLTCIVSETYLYMYSWSNTESEDMVSVENSRIVRTKTSLYICMYIYVCVCVCVEYVSV